MDNFDEKESQYLALCQMYFVLDYSQLKVPRCLVL